MQGRKLKCVFSESQITKVVTKSVLKVTSDMLSDGDIPRIYIVFLVFLQN